MKPRVTTLDRYVLREWSRIFAAVMIGFPLLVMVIDVTDKLDTYLGRGLSKARVAWGYLFSFPQMMFFVLPAAVLFATVFTVGNLSRHSEITAAKAGGVSFHRLVRPLFVVAVIAFFGGIVLAEIAPGASVHKAEILGDRAVRRTTARYNFVYRADSGWVYVIRTLDVNARTMQETVLERVGTGPDYPTIDIAAQRASYDPKARRWTLRAGSMRFLLGGDHEVAFTFDSMRTASLHETPQDLLAEPKAPDEMRYGELGRYIDALARSGADVKRLTVERALKISVPFTCIIIALFGAPLAVSSPRGGAAWGVAVSLATTFVFLLAVQLSKAVGSGGVLPPTFAAWFPNLVFAVLAAWLLRRVRT